MKNPILKISANGKTLTLRGCFEITQKSFSITLPEYIQNLISTDDEFEIFIKDDGENNCTSDVCLGKYFFERLKHFEESCGIVLRKHYEYTFTRNHTS